MHILKDEIAEGAAFNLGLEAVRKELGQDYYEIAELLTHGLTKRKVASILNMPYPKLKDKIVKIKEVLTKSYQSD